MIRDEVDALIKKKKQIENELKEVKEYIENTNKEQNHLKEGILRCSMR